MPKKLLDRLKVVFSHEEEEQTLVDDHVERGTTHPPAQPDVIKPTCKPFIVKVDDNYHFMNEDHRYIAGEFDT